MKRFALIGAGFIGSVHARNLADHPRIDFALVADVDPARARDIAERYGAREASVDEVFTADIDAVVIASSTDTHADYVERAAEAGKAIFCEKPIHLDTRRAEAAVNAVRRAGVPMMMSFTRRFDASHAALRQAVERDKLGRVELVQMTCRSHETPPLSYLEVSGGQMRDQAIHFFDLLCWLTNDVPLEVHAMGAALSDERIAEIGDVDTSVVALRMASGALAQFDFTRRTGYGYDERIEVFGAEGMAESRRQPYRHMSLYRGDHQHQDGLHPGWFERIEPTFKAATDTFVCALHDETNDHPDHEDALRAQRIADAATHSLATRTPVAIDWS